MPLQLNPQLRKSYPCEEVSVTGGSEQIIVINGASIVLYEGALLRDRFVEFKPAQLEIQPVRARKIVETYPDLGQINAAVPDEGLNKERDVLVKRTGSNHVKATQIEAGCSHR